MRAIWVVLLGLKNNRASISSRMQILHFGQIHNDGEYVLFLGIVRLVRFGVDRPSKMLLGHKYVPSSGDVGCLPIVSHFRDLQLQNTLLLTPRMSSHFHQLLR